MPKPIRIIGAGLAGSEAAWQCARRGLHVDLYEMRPVRSTPAHQTANFAELVCSNSLKSDTENTAPWLLKEEMRRAGSLLMQIAQQTAVPAGHALAVDREHFSQSVTKTIEGEPLIRVVREEVTSIGENDGITIVATGPLTSDALSQEILRLSRDPGLAQLKGEPGAQAQPTGEAGAQAQLTGEPGAQGQPTGEAGAQGQLKNEPGAPHNGEAGAQNAQLYFYDSISPIVEADSIDMSRVYMAARYDKGSADYINCPMTKDEYDRFLDALIEAQSVDAKEWEKLNYFEGCLPIEEIARRGRDTLRFGPMKPVGLRDPKTGHMPYAVVQLRQENLRADSYNLVGFQNHLKFGEQARILRMIPGLENAKFLRYGQIHRNTYINGPTLLSETLQMKQHRNVIFAGQISGVEGYVESIATGVLAGMAAAALANEVAPVSPPRATAFGALVNYICHADPKNFQPANITFDLLLPLDEATRRRIRDKKQRHAMVCDRALAELQGWLERAAVPTAVSS